MELRKVGERFTAEIDHGDHRLRLFSEATPFGAVAVIFDMKTREWVTREWVDSLDEGKRRIEKIVGSLVGKLPTVDWRERSH
jgi:hypothetical protein